jgi:carbamoyl-phosphate synthase small subunit
LSEDFSHWNSTTSLREWLMMERIPALAGIDTRSLTIKLREKGTMLGKIIIGDDPASRIPLTDPNKENLVSQVSITSPKIRGTGTYKVIAIDCGMKNNIVRRLLERDVTIKQVPWDYQIRDEAYDGIFISNGPGDPMRCTETIANLQHALEMGKPIFGICLGHQLLALAAGARTYKLKYGHRSHNQPCSSNGKGFITSQNHGFAVNAASLPRGWVETFTNAHDKTNEGIRHSTLPFFSVQFHPEGRGGPTDTDFLFDDFVSLMRRMR